MSHLSPYWELTFLIFNGAFLNMKALHIDVSCISMQSNSKNSPPIASNQISYRIMKLTLNIYKKLEIFCKLKFCRL